MKEPLVEGLSIGSFYKSTLTMQRVGLGGYILSHPTMGLQRNRFKLSTIV